MFAAVMGGEQRRGGAPMLSFLLRRGMTFVSSSRFEASRRGRIGSSRVGGIKRPTESKSASLDAWDSQLAIMRRKDPPQPMGLRIALLIDAENITYKNVDGIMNEVEKLGVVQIRRIYADWTSEVMRGWRQTVLTNALTPIHQFQSSLGKGNSDSALIIDAMDLLYKNKDIESFCIVSSDADFTRLATKLREEGKLVLGIGSNYTPAPFVVACNRFVYLHNLTKDDEDGKVAAPAPNSGSQPDFVARKTTAVPPQQQQQQQQQHQPQQVASLLQHIKPVSKPATTAAPVQPRHVVVPPPAAVVSSKRAAAAATTTTTTTRKPLDLTLPSSPAIKRAVVMDVTAEAAAKQAAAAVQKKPELFTDKLLPLLTRAWSTVRHDSGWASTAHLIAELLRIAPDMDASAYGKYTKLEDLFELAVHGFEVKKQKGKVTHMRRIMAGKNATTEVDSSTTEFDEEEEEEEVEETANVKQARTAAVIVEAAEEKKVEQATPTVAAAAEEVKQTAASEEEEAATPTTTPPKEVSLSQAVLPLLTRAWSSARLDSGWASYSHVNAELLRISPEFDASQYGPYTTLDEMLQSTAGFQVAKRSGRVSMVRRTIRDCGEESTTTDAGSNGDDDDLDTDTL